MLSEQKKKDIDKIAFDALTKSSALGQYPTPVDKVLQYADLRVNSKVDLSVVPEHYLAKFGLVLKRAVSKVRGVLVRNDRIILLDNEQSTQRKNFVKLHETAHDLLYWQGKLINCLDDDETLAPETNELFEAEANYFASAVLFQQEMFSDQLLTMPLGMSSARALAKNFGSSVHAAARRYVEHSPKRCILLILNKENPVGFGWPKITLRNSLQSPSFTREFGTLTWDTELGVDYTFVQEYINGRRDLQSEISILTDNGYINCTYHFFNNTYNGFVLIFPQGETIKSRTRFVFTEAV
ncbi:ImmA/IrrE family metallo-endopeptidase [Mucilaginibacter sp. SP1R1]|uniref:ImmA/IrrE family metallo-endopeptidase n=1 Tax=Mucilaginibacter sp. SP1R1 TaxID=2723091 RepID=UPI00161D52AF|nr:ImmA/IrrE family metallo-endopeptidase [Mucilaginibacter sp. SP1R1]MBB6149585.1 hypothetical protein [Mucilaginibacter sp. SP1R1]